MGRHTGSPCSLVLRRRLEYRGYDSAGVAIVETKGDMTIKKKVRCRGVIWL